MVGAGMFMLGIGFLAWFMARRGTLTENKFILKMLCCLLPVSYVANATGWFVTEAGRQPWLVVGLQTTAQGVSPNVTATEIWISMIGFTLVYATLAIAAVYVARKYIVQGPVDEEENVAKGTKGATLWN